MEASIGYSQSQHCEDLLALDLILEVFADSGAISRHKRKIASAVPSRTGLSKRCECGAASDCFSTHNRAILHNLFFRMLFSLACVQLSPLLVSEHSVMMNQVLAAGSKAYSSMTLGLHWSTLKSEVGVNSSAHGHFCSDFCSTSSTEFSTQVGLTLVFIQ